MKRLSLPGLLVCLASPAVAQEQPLTGEEFAAIVEGKTMDTYDETGLFGKETFLPDRRTLWRDADDRCLKGRWTEADGIICYTYEGDDPGPFCSSFYVRGDWLLGFGDGIWGNDPIMLRPSEDVVTCDEFRGS